MWTDGVLAPELSCTAFEYESGQKWNELHLPRKPKDRFPYSFRGGGVVVEGLIGSRTQTRPWWVRGAQCGEDAVVGVGGRGLGAVLEAGGGKSVPCKEDMGL